MAAALAGGAILGAGVGIAGGIMQQRTAAKSLTAQKKMGRAASRQQQAMSAQVGAEAEFARENLRASEQARLGVTSMLGAPGTYGPAPGGEDFGLGMPAGLSGIAAPGAFPGGIWGEEVTKKGLIKGGKYSKKTGRLKGSVPWEVKGRVLDPEALAGGIMAQPQFGAVSAMVAEANQLMNREGPLWNELNNSIVGSVYEGAASMQRQQMEEISRMMARGGNAKAMGQTMAQRFKVQEDVNRMRTTQLWQSRMALDQWRTQAVQSNLSFANAWVDNQAGIRDTYQAALANTRTFWSSTIPAAAMGAQAQVTGSTQKAMGQSYDAVMSAQGTKFNAIMGAVEGITGALVAKTA